MSRKMHPSQTLHDAKYKDKNRAKGHVQVTVWVPESRKEELKGIAKGMREDAQGA